MSDKKNIDRLFQEKFKDFEVAPNDAIWNRINESLPNKKKKRRVVALWWQIGGVAAVITLMLTAGISIFNSEDLNNSDLPIVNTDNTDSETNSDNDNNTTTEQNKLNKTKEAEKIKFVDTENDLIIEQQERTTSKKDNVYNKLINSNNYQQKSNAVANNFNEKEKTSASQKSNDLTTLIKKDNNSKVTLNTKTSHLNSQNTEDTQLVNDKEIKSAIKKTIVENKTAITENTSSSKSDLENSTTESKNNDELKVESSIVEDLNKQDIKEAIAENTIDEKEEEKENRWSIAPNVAPVYYSSLGNGSSLDKQFNENSKSSDINMSYGITGSYAVSKKLKIRAGVNRVNLSQTTSDIFAFSGGETAARSADAQFSNIKFNENIPSVSLMNSEMLNRSSAPEIFNTKIAGNIAQKFGFIEVPLELEYSVLDNKFSLNLIGGFSTFFLNQNDIYADINGTSTLIGEAENLNSTSFSANLGLGLDYSLSTQWNINLEPTFKYQINTFNNTSGDFNPFFVGVYTGLSFKF